MAQDAEGAREEFLREDRERQEGADPLRGSRTSAFWAGTVALGVVLLLLIIFIVQNTRETTVSFLAWDGRVSVAVVSMIAALAGLVLGLISGLLRILQLRRRVRRTRH